MAVYQLNQTLIMLNRLGYVVNALKDYRNLPCELTADQADDDSGE